MARRLRSATLLGRNLWLANLQVPRETNLRPIVGGGESPHMLTASLQATSATPVVAVAGALALAAVLFVFLLSFVMYRRSGRR